MATYFNPLNSLSGLVFIDLFGVGLGLLGSLGFALNITFGLAQTCNTLGESVRYVMLQLFIGVTFLVLSLSLSLAAVA